MNITRQEREGIVREQVRHIRVAAKKVLNERHRAEGYRRLQGATVVLYLLLFEAERLRGQKRQILETVLKDFRERHAPVA